MSLHIYLPQDRLRALATNTTLPDRTSGAALFADISGFTPLTESLRESLGPRRGAEELTRHLDQVYTALIAEVECYGGSVIEFAGDSIMCWFDDLSSGSPSLKGAEGMRSGAAPLAVTCAFAMQKAMQAYKIIPLPNGTSTALALKVAVASGPARRFVVGDPHIHYIDMLVGTTVARTSIAEHLAQRGDVVLDEATVNVLGDSLVVKEWRTDQDSGERFAVVSRCVETVPLTERSPVPSLSITHLRNWLPKSQMDRAESFLTEFRPCVALFLRFLGIDYDAEDAQAQLDTFIRGLQSIVERHEGTVLQVTVGDKGSYAYINFGALSTHEDNTRRAVKAALEIKKLSTLRLQMGLTQGIMRVGAYGAETRKTFGALGDDVNLAARLMTTAAAGEILLSSHVHKAVMHDFTFEPRPPLLMKGKAEPLPVFAVTGERMQRAVRLQEPTYSLPMVGRTQELQIINDKLDLAAKGQGQVIGIVAEAGLGKSRLVAEVIRSARRKGFVGYGGACQSDGLHTPYLAWKSIWGAFFDVDPHMPLRKQIRNIEGEIEDRAPDRLEAMPLLNTVLDLDIPENDFTQNLEPKIRQSALHALLEDCLKSAAKDEPLLIVIEDLHWIDALSHDLLEGLAKALSYHAVCFVLAYRPPQLERLQAPRLEALMQFTRVELRELTIAEAESAIRAKLAQLYPARGSALPEGLVEVLMARAQGNPFFLEELLNYVRDRGLDPSDLHSIELPDSLHTLILSRIDQLSEQEKTTLRVASIVGRLFRAAWLNGYYPELGSIPQVKVVLDQLDELDITPLDSEPELTYLFKHIVTHEVTYESLPFGTRARLHEQLAKYLESVDAAVDTIAFHYGRSENKEKQCEYSRKAGEAAQKSFANDAALEYYGMLLPLLNDPKEQAGIHLKRGEVLQLLGKYDESERDYRLALDSAKDDAALKASAQSALGRLNRYRGEYEAALDWLAQAKAARMALEDMIGLAQVLIQAGQVMGHKSDYEQARNAFNEALALARQAGARLEVSRALNSLGIVSCDQGDYTAARAQLKESLMLSREIGDKVGVSAALNNLGLVAMYQGNHAAARALYEESLVLDREMGDKWGIAIDLGNLGNVAISQSNYPAARASYEESLVLFREIGDKRSIALSLNNAGELALIQGGYTAARAQFEESLALSREIGDKWQIAMTLGNLGGLAYAQGDFDTTRALLEESLALGREIADKRHISSALNNLGIIAVHQGNHTAARSSLEESLALCKEMDEKTQMASALLGLGLVDGAEGRSEARENILHSLRLRQETGERLSQTSCLVGVAVLALREGSSHFAAQLLGAVESALRTLGAVVELDVLPFHTQALAAARDQLGEAAFQFAWEEGAAWSLEEAVQRALGESGE